MFGSCGMRLTGTVDTLNCAGPLCAFGGPITQPPGSGPLRFIPYGRASLRTLAERVFTRHKGRGIGGAPRRGLSTPKTQHLAPTFEERPILQLAIGCLDLFLSVHNDGAMPGHRLLQRLAGDQQKPDAVLPGLHLNLVTRVEQD